MTARSGEPSGDAKADRQEIIEESIEERSHGVEEASGDAVADDLETVISEASMAPRGSSIADLIASIRARSEAEGQSSENATRPAPFARSSGSQAAETLRKPSLKRSPTSVPHDSCLHNEAAIVGAKHGKRSADERRRSLCNLRLHAVDKCNDSLHTAFSFKRMTM